MKITRIQTLLMRSPDSSQVSGQGEFLVTPMHVFPDYRSVLGDGFVGLRGGPVGAVLVQVETDEGLTGLASTGVGNGWRGGNGFGARVGIVPLTISCVSDSCA